MTTYHVDGELRERLLTAQRNEITEYQIYSRLARAHKDPENSRVLQQIAEDEKRHHDFWETYTGENAEPDQLRVWKYYLISQLFGVTFGIKLMERGEEEAQGSYGDIAVELPSAQEIANDEDLHEDQLIDMIEEERLQYIGAIVLGLNDALVELTGALSGMTLVLGNTRLIATTGLITGIAAAFSMAGSGYLAFRSGEQEGEPIKGAAYTGTAYILTVLFLVFPYFVFDNLYLGLGFLLLNAIIIIALFNYYLSIAKDQGFWPKFLEMGAISMGIALLTFGIGYLIREVFGVQI
jgi:VIT1/CCC1 family predicted Fe2+/Mn2+ transporter